jgi:hypothetical protein
MTEKQKTFLKWSMAVLLLIAAFIDDYLFFTNPATTSLSRSILSDIANCIFTCAAIFFAFWAMRKK